MEKDLSLKVKKIDAPASLSDMAYEAIRESLLEIDFSKLPDEGRLDERELAARLGVSRTPLREAINRLEVEGFVRIVPRKGVYIVKKSKDEIREILIVRAALESMAARLATQYITDQELLQAKKLFAAFQPANVEKMIAKYADANVKFHELVLKASRCRKLIEMASNLYDHIRFIRMRTMSLRERPGQSLEEHLAIVAALEKRDSNQAGDRMREHIEGLASYVDRYVRFLP
jgi:DNA-binding GntR family transcriptional regulator